MANTYTQLYIHYVFVVKFRNGQINPNWKLNLYKYICGIVRNNQQAVISINGVSDHIHLLIKVNASQSISELGQLIKTNSSKWINEQKLTDIRFEWQKGFAAFSCSQSHADRLIKYIDNQEEHHRKKTYIEECKELLESYKVDYDERYVFKTLE